MDEHYQVRDAILVMLVCLAAVIVTIELAKLSGFSFIADHRNVIVSVVSK